MGRGSTARANNRSSSRYQAPTQFDPQYSPNIKRSLSKNDVELAALTKLHIALRTLKSAIIDEFGDEVLVECVLNEKKELLALAGSSKNGGGDKSKKINDGTPATASDDDVFTSIIDTLDETQQKRLRQLSTAFLLRMKLRRRLLNRLARRLHRVAHVVDGGIQITAPLPPTYGDAVRTYITEESEKSGVALKVLGTFDDVKLIRESDVKEFVNKEDERKEIMAKLSEQRMKRLGIEGVDGDDDSMNVEPKSDLDLLLKCDEEDKPLLDKLVTYEPGYDKVYSTGPPPLPAVSSSSPSKKSKSSPSKSKGKDKNKSSSVVVDKAPSSPSSATSTKDVSSPSGSKQSSTAASKEDQINITKPIASTTDDHEVDEEGEFVQTQDGIMKRLTFSIHGGQSQRAMHPGDRVSEWKRWTKEMCDRIPDQVTYDELGVGGVGMVFDLEGRVKRKRDDGSEKAVAAPREEDNRGKGKVLKRNNSPEKAKDNEDDNNSKEEDVTMGDAANDPKEAKSKEKKEEEEEETDKKDESKVSTKTFSVTPIPSFHYMDLRRISNHQAELVQVCNQQSSAEIIAKAQVVYDEAYALSVQLQKDIAAGKGESQKMHVEHKQALDAIANSSRMQAADARTHWTSRQAKLNQMKEELGEEQAFVKNVCNDVLQDLKDRVCIRVPDMNEQIHSGLGSKRLEMEATKARTNDDANRDSAANVLGHMIDTVERRHNDMLADYDKFVQPKISDDRSTIADPKTGQTVEQQLKVQREKMAAKIQKLEADFADAEKKRGAAWQALTQAKSSAGQMTKQQSRSRKSTSSSSYTAARQYPVQQQQQQQMLQQQQQQMMMMQRQQMMQQQMRQQAAYQQQHQLQPTRQPTAEEINVLMGLGYQRHSIMTMTPQQIQYYIQSNNQRSEQGYLQRQYQTQMGSQPVSRSNNVQPAASAQPSAAAAAAVESSATSVAGSQGSVGADGEPKKKTARDVYGDKYSSANVKARHNPDGSVIPASAPKMLSDGSFAKPSGRQRKGCDWDSVRGVWVPIPNYQDVGGSSKGGGGDQI